MSVRVVFMGTPEFAVSALEELVASEYELVGVYTQPDRPAGRGRTPVPPPVKRVALDLGLQVFQPASLRDPAEVERLTALRPDVVIVAAYGLILPRGILDVPEHGCLNVHPSLLPRYRGATPIPAAILAGDEDSGVTIMLMDERMDTGPILSQFVTGIEPDDTTGSLTVRLAGVGARLLAETIPLWLDGSLRAQPQDGSKATYTLPIAKSDGAIDWNMPAAEIERRVRAFNPWPGCFTRWRGKALRIHEAVALHKAGQALPGSVIQLESGHPAVVGVATGEGTLGLLSIQLEGRRTIPVVEFLRGQRDLVGGVLGVETGG